MFKKLLLLITLTAALSGCATQSGAITERDKVALEGRIEALEATQTRLRTRVVALEKSVAQLDERLTLMSRRTSLEPREVVRIEPSAQPSTRQTVTATPSYDAKAYDETAADDVYEEIIISDDKKRIYFGKNSIPGPSSSSSSSGSTERKPYDNVTTEKLPSLSGGQNGAAPVPPKSAPVSPMTYYQEGIDLYRRGLYEEGRARFEQFLATNPETEYIDNALYWIGECYYGQGLYNEAASYFHKIVQEYPKTNKVPDALLKVSLTYQQLGRTDSAREMLRYLMDAYPGSEAARIGKEKYEAMTQSP